MGPTRKLGTAGDLLSHMVAQKGESEITDDAVLGRLSEIVLSQTRWFQTYLAHVRPS